MDRIRLELNYLDLDRNKKRWSLYLVLATEHPEIPGDIAVSIIPSNYIKVRKAADNLVQFEPEGEGTEGLFALRAEYARRFFHQSQVMGDAFKETSQISWRKAS